MTRARRYCISPDCPYHDECSKSINRLRGQEGWAVMADLSGVCRKYIGWVYEQIGEMDKNSGRKEEQHD